MNVQVEHLENHLARLNVTLDADTVLAARQKAARHLAKHVRIPGFRPGKAPYKVVQRMLGDNAILQEALDALIDKHYREALEQSEVDPIAPGSFIDFEEDESGALNLVFEVPKAPTVDLKDYRELRGELEIETITDEIVDQNLESIQEQRAIVEEVERAAQIGDQVELDIVARFWHEEDQDHDDDHDADVDSEAETEPEAAEDHEVEAQQDDAAQDDDAHDDAAHDHGHYHNLIDEEAYTITLREADDERDLLPGFSAEIVGMSADEEKSFTLTMPDDFEDEMMAGKPVEVEVAVLSVRNRTLPALNDLFAQQVLEDEEKGLLDLRMEVRQDLEKSAENSAREELYDGIVQQIVDQAEVAYPEALVESYIDDTMRSIENFIEQQTQMKLDDFLRVSGQDRSAMRQEQREGSIKRLRQDLVLGELIEREGIALDNDAITRELDKMAASFGDQADLYRNLLDTPQYRQQVANGLINNRLLKRVVDIATGANPPVGPDPEPEIEDADEDAGLMPASEIVLDQTGDSTPLPVSEADADLDNQDETENEE